MRSILQNNMQNKFGFLIRRKELGGCCTEDRANKTQTMGFRQICVMCLAIGATAVISTTAGQEVNSNSLSATECKLAKYPLLAVGGVSVVR